MDYGKIISTGFKQAWKHKTLWIFGFLISGGTGFNLPNISDRFEGVELGKYRIPDIEKFVIAHLYIILLLAALAFLIFVVWFILSIIATGGLIDAAGQMKRNEPYRFGKAFKMGAHYFWRLLGIVLLTFIVVFAFIIFLFLLGVAAFVIHTAIGILSLLLLIPIFILVLFVIIITVAMAERYIVLKDRPVFDSISDGVNLWKSNLGPSVIYTLIYIGLSIAIFLAVFVLLLFVIMPFIAIGFFNLILALLAGIPIVLLFLLVVRGFTESGLHLMTTEFYFQLLERTQPAVAAQPGDAGSGYSSPASPPPPPPPPPSDIG